MDNDVNARTVELLALLGIRVIEAHELPAAPDAPGRRPAMHFFRSHNLVLLDASLDEDGRRQALDLSLAATLGLTSGPRRSHGADRARRGTE